MPREKKIPNPSDIIDAAFDIIDAEGFEAFSARKLAAKLGVAHMTVYNYYSRDYILGAVIKRGFMLIHKMIDNDLIRHLKDGKEPIEIYLIIAEKLLDFAREHPHIYRFMFQEESTETINNASVRRQYFGGAEMLKNRIPDEDYADLKNDSYLYLLMLNGLILAYLSERHGMNEELYIYNSKRTFEMILGKFRTV